MTGELGISVKLPSTATIGGSTEHIPASAINSKDIYSRCGSDGSITTNASASTSASGRSQHDSARMKTEIGVGRVPPMNKEEQIPAEPSKLPSSSNKDTRTARNGRRVGPSVSPSCSSAYVRYLGQFYKTQMCKYFLNGYCNRGDQCTHAHSESELSSKPDLSKARLCKTLLQNGKCDMPNCRYAHDLTTVETANAFFRTKMCEYALRGRCKLGDRCRYAHSESQLIRDPVDDHAGERDKGLGAKQRGLVDWKKSRKELVKPNASSCSSSMYGPPSTSTSDRLSTTTTTVSCHATTADEHYAESTSVDSEPSAGDYLTCRTYVDPTSESGMPPCVSEPSTSSFPGGWSPNSCSTTNDEVPYVGGVQKFGLPHTLGVAPRQNFDVGSQNFGSAPPNFGTVAQNYGSSPQNFGTVAQNWGSSPQNFGNVAPNFGSAPPNLGNAPYYMMPVMMMVPMTAPPNGGYSCSIVPAPNSYSSRGYYQDGGYYCGSFPSVFDPHFEEQMQK